jgi:hypothetical protein
MLCWNAMLCLRQRSIRADFELGQGIPKRRQEMVDKTYWNDYFDTHNDGRFEDLVNDFYTEDATFGNPKTQVRGRKELIGFLKQAIQDVKIELIPRTIVMNPGVTAVELDCVIHAKQDLPNFLLGPMNTGDTASIGMAAIYHLKKTGLLGHGFTGGPYKPLKECT